MRSVLDLMCVTPEDEVEALGEDRVGVVRGRRRSALRYLRKENLDDPTDNGQDPSGHHRAWGSGCIPSGGGTRKKGKRPLVIFQNTASQTDPYRRVLRPQRSHNDPTLPSLTSEPRDIQLEEPVYLAEATRPGARFGREGKLTQTPLQMAGPDLLPLSAVFEEHEGSNRNKPTNIKLNLWAPDHIRLQKKDVRDGEWLEVESDEGDDLESEAEDSANNVDKYSDELMKSLRFLFLIMKIGGRWPYQTFVDRSSPSFRLKQLSWSYVAFLLTSLAHFYVTIISLLRTFTFIYGVEAKESEYKPPVIEQIQRLEFDKYWHYAFWTYITAIFVSIWNLILLVDGMSILNLLNRWPLVVTKLKYEPTAGIRFLTISSSVMFSVYAISLIINLFTESVPAVSGSAGVLGSLFFSYSFPQIRFSRHFDLVRLFGLFFHLYTVYAAEVAMLFILTTNKLIENSATIWNLRFATRFGMTGKRRGVPRYKVMTYRAGIPLVHLAVEQKIITSLSRHTAFIFHTTMNAYLVTKGLEMILFMYRSLAFLLIPDQVHFEKTHVEGFIGESGDILAYKDSEAQRHLTCFFVTGIVIVSWLTTSIGLVKAGEVFLGGSWLVARLGYMLCKTTLERNFVHSLDTQFGSVFEYTMRAGSYYNRRTILEFFIWILIFTLGLMSFNPFNLQKHRIRGCTPGLGLQPASCETFHMSIMDGLLTHGLKRSTPPPPAVCNTWWYELEPGGASRRNVSTSVLTLDLIACDVNGKEIPPYLTDHCERGQNVAPYAKSPAGGLFECQKPTPNQITDFDDCGNIRLGNAAKVVVTLVVSSPTGAVTLMCVQCFNYTQFGTDNTNSLKYCHMQSSDQALVACKRGTHYFKTFPKPPAPKLKCLIKPMSFFSCPMDSDWKDFYLGVNHSSVEFKIPAACEDGGKAHRPFLAEQGGRCFNYTNPNNDPNLHPPSPWNGARPYAYPGVADPLYSCGGNTMTPIANMDRDDCGNLAHVDPGFVKKIPVVMEEKNPTGAVGLYYLLCCFDYYFLKLNDVTIKTCHTANENQSRFACKQGLLVPGPDVPQDLETYCD